MNYIIKYLQDNQEKYKPVESKAELEKIKDGLNVVEIRENEQSFESFMEDSANQGIIYPNFHEQYFLKSKKTSVDDFGEKNHSASCRRFLRSKTILPILVLACIIGGIAIVHSKQKRDARNARAQTRAVQAAGFDITGTYTKKEIHEITDAINHGNGTITMDEFNNILSRQTREKMCSNGDIKVFPRLAGLGGTASAGNGAQFKNRKRSTKGWTERMNASNGLLVCRSNYGSRFSPRYNYYAFLPNPDSKNGCRGVMMVIMMQYIKEKQSFTVFYPDFSATYEVRDGKVHFTNCYEWHFSNFEKGRRKRIPDDFDGTWSVKDGVLKMETKMYDAQWSRWLDATLVEEDMHEYRQDGLRGEFARLAQFD